ncbi:glycosyltransferase family 2 protein [Spongiivirga sp. MCCC 1A20706]|uniref:glycosyltransferase family 2 protein n=1 Tax=Spongiivirga sp. MCCC 1A20706 TaxID=3160963 RepID=UPI003977D827
MNISVIISTYNAEAWLEKVLIGYDMQIFKDFEMVIADDGSGPKTKALIDKYQKLVSYPIVHVWQEDDGFQKSRILNKAVEACSAPYIVMSDGDCIPRQDFLKIHEEHKERGYFLSGGYFMLPMNISEVINEADIRSGRCFDAKWLAANGLPSSFKTNKLTSHGFKSRLLNKLTPTNASWNGHNASGWKDDILAINGFDERMQYGGQDRELGERLFNLGIKSKQIRYSAICIHLDHPRGYKNKESIAKNRAIRFETRSKKLKWTDHGIQKKEEVLSETA